MNVSFASLAATRTRALLVSLVLIAALAVPSFALVAGADASASPSIAKKKKKKCKKGYKKTKKGKCKKNATKPKTSGLVKSVTLKSIDPSAYGTELNGTLVVSKPFTSLKVTVYRSRGGAARTREQTITSDGVATTVEFKVRAPIVPTSERTKAPIIYWVEADGITSNKL